MRMFYFTCPKLRYRVTLVLGSTHLPRQVGAVEVPEGSGFLEGEGFGDFDNTGTSLIGGEVWDLGGVFAHPFLERSTELGLGPA